jgi:hypothetical protein
MSFPRWPLVVQTCVVLASTGCGAEKEDPPGGGSGGAATAGSGSGSGGKGGGSAGTPSGGSAGTFAGNGGTPGGGGKGAGGASGGSAGGGTGPAGTGGSAAGQAGMGGSAAGTSGSGGGTAGTGGGKNQGNCQFTITSSTSKAIPTVGIVEWSTDLANLTEASIEFTLDDAKADELNTGSGGPIDFAGTTHTALLLGMKAQRPYTFRIVATAGGTVCTSADQTITTGALASGLPMITHRVENAAAIDKGFIITSPGISMGGGGGGGAAFAYIIDSDGDIVWWASAPASCSRALMNYEGTDMWMLELNVDNAGGEMRRVSMDGMDVEMNVEGLSRVHHDFTVLPGGIVAGPSWVSTGRDPPSDLIERSPDGTIDVVATIDENIYRSTTYHTNAIVYYPESDTYTLGDRNPNAFVKLSRTGEVLWQFGGSCSNSPAPKCAEGSWQVNHGHQLLPNGNFLFFNNGAGMASSSTAYEYSLTEAASSLTANMVWSYSASGVGSMVLGDVQRLPNGNTLVIYSNAGDIHEVDPQERFVQAFESTSIGYANFRKSLYGPPLR